MPQKNKSNETKYNIKRFIFALEIKNMDNKAKYKTNILFPRSSFLKGFGSVLNISGNYYEFDFSKSSLNADTKAIKSDWAIVGQDIREAAKCILQKSKK
ncbi:MAG: hypothetical protein WAU01_09195 [Saprospiraceae bacterium]